MENCPFKSRIHCIHEPCSKNTGPAIALACLEALKKNKAHHVIVSLPADHFISPERLFRENLKQMCEIAHEGAVVLMGIQPRFAATGYGYIQISQTLQDSEASQVSKDLQEARVESQAAQTLQASHETARVILQFHEKPSLEKATLYLEKGNYLWNAGIMAFQVHTMVQLFEKYAPALWEDVKTFSENPQKNQNVYKNLASTSLEYALLEKVETKELKCLPTHFYWSDVGSWDSLSEVQGVWRKSSDPKNTDEPIFYPRCKK